MKRTMNVLSLTLLLSLGFSNTAFSGFWSSKKVEPTLLEKSIKLVKNPWTGAAALTAACIAGLIWFNNGPKTPPSAPSVEAQSKKEETKQTKPGFFSRLGSKIAKPFVASKNYVASIFSSKEKKTEETTVEEKKDEKKQTTVQNGATKANVTTFRGKPGRCTSGRGKSGRCTSGSCSTGRCPVGKSGRRGNGSTPVPFFGTTVK